MNRELYAACDNIVSRYGRKTGNGQMILFHDAVKDVLQQMIAVNARDDNLYRIETIRTWLKIFYCHNHVSFFRSHSDSLGTVTAMENDTFL